MGLAFEMSRAALRLADRADPAIEILAKKIIALAKEGIRDPNLMSEWALDDLREPRHGAQVTSASAVALGRRHRAPWLKRAGAISVPIRPLAADIRAVAPADSCGAPIGVYLILLRSFSSHSGHR
jgi:hypothetical protein